MATAVLRGNQSFEYVRQGMLNGVLQSGVSVNLVDEAFYDFEQMKFSVLVFEKYFMRVGNRLSVTITIVEPPQGDLEVIVIGAAGGTGAFLRFSWGSEDSFVGSVVDVATSLGLTYVSSD